jgi:hypothetical protein
MANLRSVDRRVWLPASGAVALLVLGCALAGVLAAGDAAAGAALDAARGRWAARGFADYRLVVQDERCAYEVVVRGERVSALPRDSCNGQMRSVSGLFAIIERDREVTPNCGVSSCPCEAVTRVRASYDATLGYPTKIEIFVTTRPNWARSETWRLFLTTGATPRCDAVNRRSLQVLAVEPL